MSEITTAIKARQAQITQLLRDIETLLRAASIMGGGTKAPAKTTRRPKAKPQSKPKDRAKTKPKAQKRHVWSAAEKAAIGKRMKAYWAKRR